MPDLTELIMIAVMIHLAFCALVLVRNIDEMEDDE